MQIYRYISREWIFGAYKIPYSKPIIVMLDDLLLQQLGWGGVWFFGFWGVFFVMVEIACVCWFFLCLFFVVSFWLVFGLVFLVWGFFE